MIVQKRASVPGRLERVNVATGMRALVREADVDDLATVLAHYAFSILDDGRTGCYVSWRRVSRLFVVRGAG